MASRLGAPARASAWRPSPAVLAPLRPSREDFWTVASRTSAPMPAARGSRVPLGWDAAKSAGVLVEYERFMRLKVERKDFDARELSPSSAIDEMWHRHIIDTKACAPDCVALCGAVIHHDADGNRDFMGRRGRALTTLHHYRRVFSQEPLAAVWAFGDEIVDATLRPDGSSAAA
ncbi:hypothetical protein T492DRAFT_893986 [Pavlovales sp. CCMP2436]|nr:hypothetical protein T492DRAFT_893986 [Pavlovales sp. CCMP2436]